jgi:hypothetical protein
MGVLPKLWLAETLIKNPLAICRRSRERSEWQAYTGK